MNQTVNKFSNYVFFVVFISIFLELKFPLFHWVSLIGMVVLYGLNLVKEKLLNIVDRYNAMEILLEEHLGEQASHALHSLLLERADEIHERNNDFFIATVGEILAQNE